MILHQFFKSHSGLKCTVFFSFFLLSVGYAQPFTLTFSDSSPHYIDLTDSLPIFIDEKSHITIDQIVEQSAIADSSLFSTAVSPKNSPRFSPIAVWSKIALHNASLQDVHGYLRVCNHADSVYVYEVQNGRVVQLHQLRAAQATFNKPVPFSTSMYPVSVSPHHTRTFYFCVYFNKKSGFHHYRELFYRSQKSSLQGLIKNYSVQFFYGGAMFVFAAFGLVLFFLFKAYKFLIFALLEIAFTWYFWEFHGVSNAIWGYPSTVENTLLSIGSLILSISFLAVSYAHLPRQFPSLSRWYIFFTVLLAPLPFALLHLSFTILSVSTLHNILILVWAFFTATLVLAAARRGNKEALLLARGFLLLLLCTVVYILPLMGLTPPLAFSSYSLQVGSLLFSSLLFYGLVQQVNALRQKQLKAQKLERLKSEFLAHIAHDFKTPLSLIMAPIQQLRDSLKLPAQRELLDVMQSNARKLEIYINQLLDLSKMESDQTQLKAQPIVLPRLISHTFTLFQSYAARKNVNLRWEGSIPEVSIWGDPQMLQSVFENLIGNALKFTERGAVILSLTANKETTEVKIKDEGKGISEEELPYIFNRFYSGSEHGEVGSGLGLAMVQNLLRLHHASISVSSKLGRGTTFTLRFKRGHQHFTASQISKDARANEEPQKVPSALAPPEFTERNTEQPSKPGDPKEVVKMGGNSLQLPHLLLVDDNAEMRDYLRKALQKDYFITEAANGVEALEQAQNHMPDLLISDMVMPEMDGLAFCKKLKKNVKTSHIPLIFLTASSSQKDKLQGLQYGADDYLTKPFDIKELQLRLSNLWRSRETLKARLLKEPASFLEKVNSTDAHFVKRINSTVESHLADANFGVAALAESMRLSPAQLNRKLKALTDFSTNQYMQHIKLSRAHQMLLNQEGNVSEIAHETGFSSTAYFVKCFREKFGKTPGSLRV